MVNKKNKEELTIEKIRENFEAVITLRRYLFSMLIVSILLFVLGYVSAAYICIIYCFIGLTFQEKLRGDLDAKEK